MYGWNLASAMQLLEVLRGLGVYTEPSESLARALINDVPGVIPSDIMQGILVYGTEHTNLDDSKGFDDAEDSGVEIVDQLGPSYIHALEEMLTHLVVVIRWNLTIIKIGYREEDKSGYHW